MADITITASALVPGSNATIKHGMSGVAIAAGKAVYIDADTDLIGLADNDNASADIRESVGIALNTTAAAGQPVSYIKAGDLAMGAILIKGDSYCVSGTPGGISPRVDVTTGDDPIILGIATSTTTLAVGLLDTDITL